MDIKTETRPEGKRLEAITDALKAALKPERIHLIGSAATDSWREGDDIDFVVVSGEYDVPPETDEAAGKITARFPDADISVCGARSFRRNCTKWYAREHGAVRGGRVLYEKPGTGPWHPPTPEEPTTAERLEDAGDRHWWGWLEIGRAVRDWDAGAAERAGREYEGAVECLRGLLTALNIRGWHKLDLAGLIDKAAAAGVEVTPDAAAARRVQAPESAGNGKRKPGLSDLHRHEKAVKAAAHWSRRLIRILEDRETDHTKPAGAPTMAARRSEFAKAAKLSDVLRQACLDLENAVKDAEDGGTGMRTDMWDGITFEDEHPELREDGGGTEDEGNPDCAEGIGFGGATLVMRNFIDLRDAAETGAYRVNGARGALNVRAGLNPEAPARLGSTIHRVSGLIDAVDAVRRGEIYEALDIMARIDDLGPVGESRGEALARLIGTAGTGGSGENARLRNGLTLHETEERIDALEKTMGDAERGTTPSENPFWDDMYIDFCDGGTERGLAFYRKTVIKELERLGC